QEVVEDGDNQLGDQCYSDTPDYSHCNEFYEKTHGIAIGAKGIYYHSESVAEAYKRARLDKVDVLNMSHGTSSPHCDPMYSTPYIDELEDAFDDGVFPVNSSGNYSDEDYSIPKYRGTGGVNHCLINDRSLVPKVFSVGAIYNKIPYYTGHEIYVEKTDGSIVPLEYWDFFDDNLNSGYNITHNNRSAYHPINSEDYGRMRLDVFGSQTGGATLVIDNSTYSRPLTGIDLLAPGSGWMSTGANGPIGIANERFCCSSGAAPHVSGLALLVKNWLLSEGVSVINNPGVLHTVMLAMGDRSVFNESSYEHDYNITGGDIMYGFGRAKLRLLGHSQGIPNSGYAADSFTFTQGNFPADGGRRLLFAGPTPEDTHFIKCVALQIEDMDNKSSTDMVSALNFKLSLADPYTNQYGTKYCSSTRPGNYYIEKDDSYDTKKMVSVSSSTGQYVEDKCLYIEFEDKHITNQGVNVKTFCYYSPVPDYASSSGHSCVKSKFYLYPYGYATSAYCWGNNDYGQLGTGDRKYKFSPEYVSNSSNVKEISAGGGHTCMIRTLSGDDYVYCWGKNHKGQLGNENTNHQTSQTLVPYFSYWNFSSYHDLALGKEHTCMLADLWGASLLFCWGSNEYGQLGISGVEYSSEPLLVDYFNNVGEVDSVSAGSYHTCVTQDNKAYCWGLNDSGQLGINNTTTASTPTQIVNISNIVSISAGGEHTCAINDYNGLNKLYCWGNNKHGQTVHGQSDNDYTYDASPVEITNIPTPVNKVSAGGYHTCAIGNGSSNSLYCWGNNSYGQLGDNNAPHGRTVSSSHPRSGIFDWGRNWIEMRGVTAPT
ncbi:MAG: S8 family serine peptidase, partial [Myxococcota bacterium]